MSRGNKMALHTLLSLEEYQAVVSKIEEIKHDLQDELVDMASRIGVTMETIKFVAGQINALDQVLKLPWGLFPDETSE